jgi:hypothetical protein
MEAVFMALDMDNYWEPFLPYQSAPYSQNYLRGIYETREIQEAVSKSYQNGYPFIYYLIHGKRFFDQAKRAPYEIKPLLLFYGTVQFCKACLLTVDQDYPENSTVLAHGVSTRKIKKQNFQFLHDSILIQKKGLFPHMASTLFGLGPLEGKKLRMEDLFHYLPDLNNLYTKIKGRLLCRPVEKGEKGTFLVERKLLIDLQMSEDRFFRLFKGIFVHEEESPSKYFFVLKAVQDIEKKQPFLTDLKGNLYLPTTKEDYPILPELLVHYLILYNLSMISRYETEWWNDLFLQRSSQDISFIQAFINLTEQKIPYLISHYLEKPFA